MKFLTLILLIICAKCDFQTIIEKFIEPVAFNDETVRIVGGKKAVMESSKHVVSVRLANLEAIKFGAGHICGGTLISQNLVLTAAHCLIDYSTETHPFRASQDFILVMGTLNRYNRTADTLQFTINYIYNKDFNLVTLQNDIALMVLNGIIPNNHPTIQPIGIAKSTPPPKTFCVIHGWGALQYGHHAIQELRYAEIPIIDKKTCALNYKDNLLDGMLCAGDTIGQTDTCQGDSGGPLVCNGQLVGIVSWGEKCATPGYPGIYTEIHKYKNWLNQQLKMNKTANLMDAKHLASIRLKLIDRQHFGSGHICSGSLIDTKDSIKKPNTTQIVTAAHCLFDHKTDLPFMAGDLTVVMGTLNRYVRTNLTLQFEVIEVNIHENYTKHSNRIFSSNDIAVLLLKGNVRANHPTVGPLKLPKDDLPINKKTCRIDGWGESYPTRKAVANIQTINITIIDKKTCDTIYEPESLDGMFCAGELDQLQDQVNTDDGGPLNCNGYLYGILSKRIDFGFQGFPSVYNDIKYHSEWIFQSAGGGTDRILSIGCVLLTFQLFFSLLIVAEFLV